MISKTIWAAIAAVTVVCAAPVWAAGAQGDIPAASASASVDPAVAAAQEKAAEDRFMAGLHPKTGKVVLPGAEATLNLGDAYYFLDKDDAKKVIVDAWGNPPSAAEDILGMVLPAGKTPFNDWGAIVTFEKSGYVSDKDAQTADYDKSITELQKAEPDVNAERKKGGFPAMHVVGWAQPPSYNASNHTLIWARDIRFDGGNVDTLNYDIRVLGRRGVLSLNMIATIPELESIRQQAVQLGAAATYDTGTRYADYKEGDTKAAYGLAGLVAAGVGLAVVKKLGLLGLILAFGKKALVIVVAAGAAIARWFGGIFGKKKKPVAPPRSAFDEEVPAEGQGVTPALENPAEGQPDHKPDPTVQKE